jgi:chemotaxis protein histidine kinase CheA
MAKQLPIEIFMPPNMLKAKVGGSMPGIDAAMLKRAEAAMEELKSEFTNWIASDVNNLVEARDRFAALNDAESRGNLFRASHDLKGGAQTYEYPLIARMAASLCKLIDSMEGTDAVPLALVDGHVDAIRALFRDGIKDASNRVAIMLTEELESRVTEALERVR